MKRNTIISLLLSVSLVLPFAGCGNRETMQSAGENIELIEPVNMSVNYEEAEYRDLYDAKVYSATVVPYIEEYSSDDGISVRDYGAYPGEAVSKGTTLVYSDSRSIDEKIEAMEKQIKDMEEQFEEYKADVADSLEEPKKQLGNLEYCVNAYEDVRPEEYVDQSSVSGNGEGGKVKNPEYESWEVEYNKYIGPYRILKHSIDTTELGLAQRTELYELDHAHFLKLLEDLKKQKRDATITSQMAGTVVAIAEKAVTITAYQYLNYYMEKDAPVVAVGDVNRKLLKCEYINAQTIKKASDIYALIDGKRYEVEYQPISSDEYVRLTAQGETVYSTFTILDSGEINMGDFAVIAVISDARKNVVSVPKGAIRKDDTGSYVYVIKDDSSVYTQVKTGMSDGAYTEILSGVSQGDRILVENAGKTGSSTAKLEKGNFGSSFEGRGWLEYSVSGYVKNPIENGTVYFVSSDIQPYQYVKKGDVIATVRVMGDEVALSRNETKRSRLAERIRDLQKLDAEANKKSIADMQEQIAELDKTITKQKADYATTQIRADRSGIAIWLREFEEEDIILPDSELIQLADEDKVYVRTEDSKQLLQFGNQVSISYEDSNRQKYTTEGMVASMSKIGVSSKLTTENVYILIPKEQVTLLSQVYVDSFSGGFWGRWYAFDVNATIREMNDVIVVPKKAVQDINGRTYVSVIDENGKITTRSFIAGGYNSEYYWVVDGLTEGMEVCLE